MQRLFDDWCQSIMKTFFIPMAACLFSIASWVSCKKNTAFMGSGTIIGFDARTGACTGGIYIKIDGHANPNDPVYGYFDIGTSPSSFQLNGSSTFPVKVKLDWKISPKCSGNYIDISRIQVE
jgi:hypothetical protein